MMLYASKVLWSNARHVLHVLQIGQSTILNTDEAQAGSVTLFELWN